MKHNALHLLIYVAMVGTDVSAQHEDHRNYMSAVDSLEHLLRENPPTGENLLRTYRDLAWGYIGSDYRKTRLYARKGLPLADESYPKAASQLHHWIGLSYYNEGLYDSVMPHYRRSLEAVEQMRAGNKYPERDVEDRIAAIYGDMGNLANTQGHYYEAIEYYTTTLTLSEKHDFKRFVAYVHENIGNVYLAMNNYEQAEAHLLQMKAVAEEVNDSLLTMMSDRELSSLYLAQERYEKALQYAGVAYSYLLLHPRESTEYPRVLNLLSRISGEGYHDAAQAEHYARQALLMADTLNDAREQSVALNILADLSLQRRDWRTAEQYALQSLAADSVEPANTLDNYEILAKVYGRQGRSDKADEYFDRHNRLQSSWSTKHYQTSLRDLEVKYETEKKQTRISTLEHERTLMLRLNLVGGIVLLLALAVFFFLWRWAVQKKRLVATKALLDGEVQERTRLARDLHDGLGSILAAAKYNLCDIKRELLASSDSAERFDTAVELVDDSMREMQRIAHHLMPEALYSTGLKQSLADFSATLPKVEFSYYGDDARLDSKLEVMIYRIVHELVSNALKHSGAEHILVQMVRDADDILLTVQDDGCGFDVFAVAAKGMGLANIRARVTAYNGNLMIDSQPGVGTEIRIEIKNKE